MLILYIDSLFKAHFKPIVTNYPFDVQRPILRFASAEYNTDYILTTHDLNLYQGLEYNATQGRPGETDIFGIQGTMMPEIELKPEIKI